MEIAMIGLGKMGANMAQRLLNGGHQLLVFDLNAEAVTAAQSSGAIATTSLDHLVNQMKQSPRAVWVMVPSGDPTEHVITTLLDLLDEGDIVIDGGNSNFNETMSRARTAAEQGIHYVDVGTSGGVWGLAEGYSMMVGGDEVAVAHITPALETLAPAADKGWGHVGASGAGHYTKMVHNGIEYGMMQAYAEGFDLLHAKPDFDLDLHQVAQIWQHGSVVRSWLLDLTADALSNDQELSEIEGYVSDSGEGRWTVIDSIELGVPTPVITLALQMRFASRDSDKYWAKMLSAMRNQFGGHAIKKVQN